MAHNLEYLSFNQIDFPHLFLCHYRPLGTGKDYLSRSLLRFKLSRQPDLAAWTDCSADLLATANLPHNTLILRALHHQETQTSHSTALDTLGKTLATTLQADYQPRLLMKKTPCRPIKTLSQKERNTELINLYTFSSPSSPPAILIIDDIFTTGTTMRAILLAILSQTPPPNNPPISLFTLAKTTYHPNSSYAVQSKNYILHPDTIWTANIHPATYIVSPHQNSSEPPALRNLKTLIQTDTFN